MLDEILEDGGIELVYDLLAITLGEDEARIAEGAEVARDRCPRRRELFGDLARRFRSVAEQVQNLAPRWIGERAEGIHGRNLLLN